MHLLLSVLTITNYQLLTTPGFQCQLSNEDPYEFTCCLSCTRHVTSTKQMMMYRVMLGHLPYREVSLQHIQIQQ